MKILAQSQGAFDSRDARQKRTRQTMPESSMQRQLNEVFSGQACTIYGNAPRDVRAHLRPPSIQQGV
jgi:hypothetical protein